MKNHKQILEERMLFMQELPHLVKKLREKKKMRQSEFCRKYGFTEVEISNYLHRKHMPRIDRVEAIRNALRKEGL